MVTSLVLQSEDLSEDSIFTYAQFTEFAIRFGLMSERAACEESDERALIYEMWCTLARVHPEAAFIKVVNLKTIITAVLGFPIAVHNERTGEIAKANSKIKEVESDFDEADMEDDIPIEGQGHTYNMHRASQENPLRTPGRHYDVEVELSTERKENRQATTIDEDEEEDGGMSSPDDFPHKRRLRHDDDDGEEDYGEGEESEENEQEYAIDRAAKIGFFIDEFEFCMTMRDVRVVQRRFQLFAQNWKEFQMKDMVVKKSVIVDDGMTFKPEINQKSQRIIDEQTSCSGVPFPDGGSQKAASRKKIWERDLPKGPKRERQSISSANSDNELLS